MPAALSSGLWAVGSGLSCMYLGKTNNNMNIKYGRG